MKKRFQDSLATLLMLQKMMYKKRIKTCKKMPSSVADLPP
jgi:hypothetical protein